MFSLVDLSCIPPRQLVFPHYPMAYSGVPALAADEYVAQGVDCHRIRLGAARHILKVIHRLPRAGPTRVHADDPVVIGAPRRKRSPARDVQNPIRVGDESAGSSAGRRRELEVVHGGPGGAAVNALANYPM